VETVLIIWLSVRMAIAGGFSLGMVFAFLAYRLQFATTAKNLIDRAIDLRMLSLHLERLSDIALTREDQGFFEPDVATAPLRGEIELKGVTYAYGIHDPQVLKGVDLRIAPGEHVAITGVSGGGKTTLAKIILGLLDPTSGEVLVDGAPLQRMGRRAFREQVAAVLQDDLLFAGTIAENVAGFDEVDPERLAAALEAAAVAQDIAAMPMKHLSLVGDMGSALSGGQRQRILLARALYRRPRLLVLDEGTAHLDLAHERAVNANISAMGITRIVIAHRRETIEAADRVITLADGKTDAGVRI
jgi:ATP-binding cassette subfamily B protein RaxB